MYGEFDFFFFSTPGVLLSQPTLAVAIVSILSKMAKKNYFPNFVPESLKRIRDYIRTDREADRQH